MAEERPTSAWTRLRQPDPLHAGVLPITPPVAVPGRGGHGASAILHNVTQMFVRNFQDLGPHWFASEAEADAWVRTYYHPETHMVVHYPLFWAVILTDLNHDGPYCKYDEPLLFETYAEALETQQGHQGRGSAGDLLRPCYALTRHGAEAEINDFLSRRRTTLAAEAVRWSRVEESD